MQELSDAITAAPVANARWILDHAVGMKIPGLGMELTRQSRVELQRLNSCSWLLGPDAQHHMQLLFEKGAESANLVGFGTAGNAAITRALTSLGIAPAAIMPNGERRYGTEAIYQLQRQSEKLEVPGQSI